ncbi:MAG: hypothetical protein OXG71_08245 [Rhodospirillales bacterium]|nr:hypothetical protein [Rhodospirillales bacterium]
MGETESLRDRVRLPHLLRRHGRLMLSGPRQLASAEQTFGYFLHEYLARNDGSHRSANRWHGEGAEALGLGQRVGKRRFISILSGEVPGTDVTPMAFG